MPVLVESMTLVLGRTSGRVVGDSEYYLQFTALIPVTRQFRPDGALTASDSLSP
jgi:hypothetical protein